MRHAELCAAVAAWVRANARVDGAAALDLPPERELIGTGLLDSVGFLELLAHLEALLGREVVLGEEDPADFTTIAGVCAFALAGAAVEAR